MKRLAIAALGVLFAHAALADTTIAPGQRATVATNGTITLGNTFQSVFAANLNRTGCIIQNTSTHTMYVYVGATASATTSNSLQIPPGSTFQCANQGGTIVVTDNIAITTSTTSDTFVAFSQN